MSAQSSHGGDAPYTVEKIPIYSRDEAPARLWGWTWSEMLMLATAAVSANTLSHSRLVTLAVIAGVYLYVRKVKSLLPERFVTNLARHYVRRDIVYRAAGRDTLWRPPILPALSARPALRRV